MQQGRAAARGVVAGLAVAMALAAGCAQEGPGGGPIVCGAGGELVELEDGQAFCVYQHPIVIETGFSCPQGLPHLHQRDGYGACSTSPEIPHHVWKVVEETLEERFGWWDSQQETTSAWGRSSHKSDILWVIDNSGAMCQEQRVLRESFGAFVDQLIAGQVDFHIGITTTHTTSYDVNTGQPLPYALEPVAMEGRLQSTPQPVAGRTSSCWHSDPDRPDFDLVAQSLEFVKDHCLEDGESFPHSWSVEQYRCAVTEQPAGCFEFSSIAVDTNGDNFFDLYDLFPRPEQYREIPKVLRRADYVDQATGAIDRARLVRDFQCASLVGTRGSGIEKGLQVAVAAVSQDRPGGPNEGFLRSDASTSVIFVTDENDCSHDGTLNERSTCGGNVCEYANHIDEADSPLIPVGELRERFMTELSRVKPMATVGDVLVASIHGAWQRYDGPQPQMCVGDDIFPSPSGHVQPSCESEALGVAFSGDRYERFARQFEHFYPQLDDPTDPAEHMKSWMCEGDFGPALRDIGALNARLHGGL